jgi:hypothetical protein
MAIRLTPETLRRIVLEEKAKISNSAPKSALDKSKLKKLELEMDEEAWHEATPPAAKKFAPGDKNMNGAGAKMKEIHELREQEEVLRGRLRRLQERRLALRKQIINEIG